MEFFGSFVIDEDIRGMSELMTKPITNTSKCFAFFIVTKYGNVPVSSPIFAADDPAAEYKMLKFKQRYTEYYRIVWAMTHYQTEQPAYIITMAKEVKKALSEIIIPPTN